MKKKLIVTFAAVLVVFGVAGSAATSTAFADENFGTSSFPPAIQALVDKFNLDEDEVKNVLEEHRTQRHEEMRTNMEEKLNQAVLDGKLTTEQMQLLLTKMEEMHNINSRPDHEEFKSWAEENNIDLSQLNLGSRGKGLGHPYHRHVDQE